MGRHMEPTGDLPNWPIRFEPDMRTVCFRSERQFRNEGALGECRRGPCSRRSLEEWPNRWIDGSFIAAAPAGAAVGTVAPEIADCRPR